jgi:hypothetical protein
MKRLAHILLAISLAIALFGVTSCKGGTRQKVELNYGDHAIVTHKQIVDTITESLSEELESGDCDYKLKKVTIEDKSINVYLDLPFVPLSRSWIVEEGESRVKFVASIGLYDENDNFIGTVYDTGYDIGCFMWTYSELDTSTTTQWGHATIFNSGEAFEFERLDRELQWKDGVGMQSFN